MIIFMNSINSNQNDHLNQVDLYTRFKQLPLDLRLHILSFLPKSSLLKVSEANKELSILASDHRLWTSYFQREFPDYRLENRSGTRSHYISVKIKQIIQETKAWISRLDLTDNSQLPSTDNLNTEYRYVVLRLSAIYQTSGLHTVLVLEPPQTIFKVHLSAFTTALFAYLNIKPHLDLCSLVKKIQNNINAKIPLLFKAMSQYNRPIALTLNGCELSRENLGLLCKLVEEGKLSELDLSDCRLGDQEAELIAKSVITPSSRVFKVVLNRNQITDIGAEFFAVWLKGNKTVHLELNANFVSLQKTEELQMKADSSLVLSFIESNS